VGENLSIVGFDDAPFVRYLQPGLSTMSQPFHYICELLVQRLDSIICDAGAVRLQKLVVPQLVIRGSSAAPQAD
jgi:DNA-binding LacI/PurR family transcriptional regulator